MHTLNHTSEKTATCQSGRLRLSWDTLGILASSLCLVHCLVLPVAVLALPALGGQVMHDDRTHYVLAFFVALFCVTAIVPAYLRHGDKRVLFCMASGLAMVLFATFVSGPMFGEAWEVPLITVGNLLVVSAHLQNRRLQACSH